MAGKFFGIPFALAGDRTVTPDAVQPDGSVSYNNGFGFDYERPNTDPDYKPVPRPGMNGLFFDLTEAVGIIQRQGLADWTAAGAPYVINARVRHLDEPWVSLIANNNDTPGATANWRLDRAAVGGFVVISATGLTNWSVPLELQQGLAKAHVEVRGAGGGGARQTGVANGPGGGGGGGVAEDFVDLTGVTSVAVTVGVGGAGAAVAGNNGTNGGSSSFGAFCSATGGAGGSAAGDGGAGGIGSGGLRNYSIGAGGVSTRAAGDGEGQGGYGGGGNSPGGSVGTTTPVTKGHGGGGRVGSAAPAGANGEVVIRW
jgi:hypothetical protein